MEGSRFDETEFFRAVATSGARALLLGRRALVILGLPVLTVDYDFWIHIDDIERFNSAVVRFDLRPNRAVDEARKLGRYVLENDERVDVLVARALSGRDGTRLVFDEVWANRRRADLGDGVSIELPTIEDLIASKRVGGRPKDLEDIRMLEVLRTKGT
jgi:hypothetical protein